MKYGCIGEKLGHSFSALIHEKLGEEEYRLCELRPEQLAPFFARMDFCAINVTIPYKEAVLPFLSRIDPAAAEIGAVNTVKNVGGAAIGYNTDFFGMESLLARAKIEVAGKKVAILGTGGTYKTARAVCTARGAARVLAVSRTPKGEQISYSDLYDRFSDTEVLVNTTPIGMFPENDWVPADLSRLPALCGVIDAIYNPLNTRLILNARERGIAAEGGLFMLCAQAVRASEIFHDRKLPPDTADRIFRAIRSEKENVVLIGMPAVGKSTVGKLLSRESGRPFFDADEEFEKKNGQIFAFFAKYGESAFRDEETRILKELSKHSGAILSTGGGSVLRQENIASLKQNGRLFWLDRDLRDITPDPHRPTANSRAAIEALYRERIDFYRRAADEIVTIGTRNGEPDFSAATEQILNARRKQYDAP